jgi:hypothetical protein
MSKRPPSARDLKQQSRDLDVLIERARRLQREIAEHLARLRGQVRIKLSYPGPERRRRPRKPR